MENSKHPPVALLNIANNNYSESIEELKEYFKVKGVHLFLVNIPTSSSENEKKLENADFEKLKKTLENGHICIKNKYGIYKAIYIPKTVNSDSDSLTHLFFTIDRFMTPIQEISKTNFETLESAIKEVPGTEKNVVFTFLPSKEEYSTFAEQFKKEDFFHHSQLHDTSSYWKEYTDLVANAPSEKLEFFVIRDFETAEKFGLKNQRILIFFLIV